MIVNVLTLPDSEDRRKALIPALQEQNITFRFHNGEVDRMIPFRGIARSHKAIVAKVKMNNEPLCCVAEDDMVFTSPGSWKHYLDNMPQDFDIYLGGISNGLLQPDNSVVDFRGLFLYTVHERFIVTIKVSIKLTGIYGREENYLVNRVNDKSARNTIISD